MLKIVDPGVLDGGTPEQARVPPRPPVTLDASVLEDEDGDAIIRENLRQNCMVYEFPSGLNQLDIREEARALTRLDDFDTMYDVAMQLLEKRDVVMVHNDPVKGRAELCAIHVTDRMQNIRAIPVIDECPWLVLWMVEFIAGMLSKKYRRLLSVPSPAEAPERKAAATRKTAPTAPDPSRS